MNNELSEMLVEFFGTGFGPVLLGAIIGYAIKSFLAQHSAVRSEVNKAKALLLLDLHQTISIQIIDTNIFKQNVRLWSSKYGIHNVYEVKKQFKNAPYPMLPNSIRVAASNLMCPFTLRSRLFYAIQENDALYDPRRYTKDQLLEVQFLERLDRLVQTLIVVRIGLERRLGLTELRGIAAIPLNLRIFWSWLFGDFGEIIFRKIPKWLSSTMKSLRRGMFNQEYLQHIVDRSRIDSVSDHENKKRE